TRPGPPERSMAGPTPAAVLAGSPACPLDPAFPFFDNHCLHRLDPGGVVVEARTPVQLLSARVQKRLARFETDLVDGLQAIRREPRRRHEHALDALPSEVPEHVIRERLQPGVSSEA